MQRHAEKLASQAPIDGRLDEPSLAVADVGERERDVDDEDEDEDGELFADAEDEDEDEDEDAEEGVAIDPWSVLIVDDEPEMHSISRLALTGLRVHGRPVQLLSAYSDAEARALLERTPGLAVALLDVVMETDDAGLGLARWIREEHGDRLVRLVLRTGQPGLAPEQRVMAEYDINDYRAKTEMTAQRLVTTVIGAIRSYRDLCTIETQKVGLERIIKATASLFERQSIEAFIAGLLVQLTALLSPQRSALFFQGRGELFRREVQSPVVLAGTGRFERAVGDYVAEVIDENIFVDLQAALERGGSICRDSYIVYGFCANERECAALFIEGAGALTEWDRRTLQLFCSNAAVALENQRLHHHKERTLQAVSRFVPLPILELLGRGDVTRVSVGDQNEREMTVLFADLESFTGLAESLGPERTFTFLNDFYAGLTPIIEARGGVVDKYLGDGVMVLFPRGPRAAVEAAVEMLRWTHAFNSRGDWPRAARLGIGVARGSVVLGMLGSRERLDWTVVADCVNVAARLERLTRELDVDLLISESVHDAIARELPATRPLGRVRVRGKETAIGVHEVFVADPAPLRERKAATVSALRSICAALESGAGDEARARLDALRERAPEDRALWTLEARWSELGAQLEPEGSSGS